MKVTIAQLIVLYIFIALGCFVGKTKKIKPEKSNILSILLVNVFLPCKIFLNFSGQFTVSYLENNYITIAISTGLLLLMVLFAKSCTSALTQDAFERRIYRYSFAISNYAYMGYVLAESVFGSMGLTNLIFFCIPFAVYTYTFGYAMLAGHGKLLSKLMNPMTAAIALGMIFGLFRIPVPSVFATVLSGASACVGPVSMVFAGLVISSFSLQEILPDRKIILFTCIRLIVIPIAVFGICLGMRALFPLPAAVYPAAVIMSCMPCGMNTVIFPALHGESSKVGAKLVLFSHLMCGFTIPLWIWIVETI